MKTIIKSISTILLGVIFSGGIILAQEQTQSDQPKNGTQIHKQILTEEQKTMLKNDLQKRKELREEFKATLTQEQKDMLTDPRVMPNDRIKSFRASLTDQQVNMIKTRHNEIKAMRNEFRATLTAEQKMQLKKMSNNKALMNRALFRKARLRHRLG
jgi:hypothetical protein